MFLDPDTCEHDWVIVVEDLDRPRVGIQHCSDCGLEVPRILPAPLDADRIPDWEIEMLEGIRERELLQEQSRDCFGPIAAGLVRRSAPRNLSPTFKEPTCP